MIIIELVEEPHLPAIIIYIYPADQQEGRWNRSRNRGYICCPLTDTDCMTLHIIKYESSQVK